MSQILEIKPEEKLVTVSKVASRQKFVGYCDICNTPKTIDVTCSKCNQPLVLMCAGKNHKSWYSTYHDCQNHL